MTGKIQDLFKIVRNMVLKIQTGTYEYPQKPKDIRTRRMAYLTQSMIGPRPGAYACACVDPVFTSQSTT